MEKRLINFLDLCIDCYYRRNVKSGPWCNELGAQANSAVCRKWRDMEKSPDFYDADELCLRCAHEFDCVTCNQIKLGQIEVESFCDDWCDEWEEKEKP